MNKENIEGALSPLKELGQALVKKPWVVDHNIEFINGGFFFDNLNLEIKYILGNLTFIEFVPEYVDGLVKHLKRGHSETYYDVDVTDALDIIDQFIKQVCGS